MNVPVHVKVPLDLFLELQDRLRRLQIAHTKAVVKEQRKGGDPADVQRRAKFFTLTNMVRMAMIHGHQVVTAMSDTQLAEALANDGIVRGRPVNAA